MDSPGHRNAPLVLVKGAGDFASGAIHRLRRAGFSIVATELERPLAVRRWVCFSEAIHEGEYTVEGVTAVRSEPNMVDAYLKAGKVPVLVDPETRILKDRAFDIVIDARSAKRNLGTRMDDAPIVVAIGPGFTAGVDCHAVVETLAGSHVGKVILEGAAAPNTGIAYPLDGATPCGCSMEYLQSLLIRSPGRGNFRLLKDIGTKVEEGDVVGRVLTNIGKVLDVKAGAKGLVRGIIRDRTEVKKGMKLGDVDPNMVMDHICTISEKARAIGGGVLEACMYLLVRKGQVW